MWEGGECWILGGGPSVTKQFDIPEVVATSVLTGEQHPSVYSPYMSAIHSKHVIGINAAYLIGTWMDFIFFGDKRFFMDRNEAFAKYPKPIITCHDFFNEGPFKWVKYLRKDGRKPDGITDDPTKVSWNQNSGAAAISVAANAGAKRIILVGFDMKVVGGEHHWHSDYKQVSRRKAYKLPFYRHLRSFGAIARDAKLRGIEIINASPESEITEFPKVEVRDLI